MSGKKSAFKIFLFSLFICFNSQLNAQFENIDNHAKNAPAHLRYDVEKLTEHLVKPAKNDLEKVRAFFVWLSENIAYDVKEYERITNDEYYAVIYSDDFERYEREQLKSAMINKKAVCHGYSLIFQKMCNIEQIENIIISGNSKNRYNDEVRDIGDHSWNAAFIDGKWRLFDPTWGSGHVSNRRYNKVFNEFYFDTQPQKMIIDHFPADPMWQLSNYPISFSDFNKKETELTQLINDTSGNYFAYKDSIQKLFSFPENMRNLVSAENAFRFNPKNTTDLGFAWNNHAVRLGNEVISMEASGADIDDIIAHNNEAIKAQKKSLKYVEDDNIREGLGIFYLNQAKFYQDKGNYSAERNKYQIAIDSYQSSLDYIALGKPLFKKRHLVLEAEGTSLLNLGFVYSNMGLELNNKARYFNMAEEYLVKAKEKLKAANTSLANQNLRIVEQNLTALRKNRRILGL